MVRHPRIRIGATRADPFTRRGRLDVWRTHGDGWAARNDFTDRTKRFWIGRYKDGTVTKWLQHVTDVYVALGAMQNPTPASTYFDPSLYLGVV